MATNGQLSNANLMPGAKKIEQDANQTARNLVWGVPQDQYQGMNAQYKNLRSSGMTEQQANDSIKSGLQQSGTFWALKQQYQAQPEVPQNMGTRTTGTPVPEQVNANSTTGMVSDGVNTRTPTGTNDFASQKNDAFAGYGNAIAPTAQDQQALDMARNDLSNLWSGETFAQAYARMQKERGTEALQGILSSQGQRAADLKSNIQQQAERQYVGSTGVTNMQGLINANSRDFARELEHATATLANTSAAISNVNNDISTALAYRQQDLETKRQNLQERIKALENKIPPAQLDLLKMKLESSINDINAKEQTAAAIAQAKLKDKMENGDIKSEDRDLRKKAVLKAINDMVAPYSKYGVTLRVPSEAHAEAILQRMEQGQTFEQAFDEDFAQPFNSSQSVLNAKTQMGGDQNQWKAQMMTSEDADGNKSQQMVFYRTGQDGKLEFVDRAGNPVNVPGSGTDTGTPNANTGWFQDYTSSLARTGNNVGQDTNNPGNIMAESAKGVEYAKSLGAVGFYKSPNGRTYAVFPDMQSGLDAMKADVDTKLNGGSYWVTWTTTLGQLASGWTSGPNAPYNKNAAANYSRISGYPENTPIMQIPRDQLINAIIKNEWVNPTVSANVTVQRQPTDSDRLQNVGKYLKDDISANKNLNKWEAQMMRKQIETAVKTGDTEYLDNRVKESISGKIKTLPDLTVTLDSIQNMKDALDRYYEKWGDTGLLTGSIETVMNKLGETTDPDLLDVRTGLGFLSADYIRSISGTAASDNERKALQQLLPMISSSTEVNKTVLDRFQKKLGSQIRTLVKTQAPQYAGEFDRLYPEANIIETSDWAFSQAYIQSEIDRQIEEWVSSDTIVKWLEKNKINPDLFK